MATSTLSRLIPINTKHEARITFVRTYNAPCTPAIWIGRGGLFDGSKGTETFEAWFKLNAAQVVNRMQPLAQALLAGKPVAFVQAWAYDAPEQVAKADAITTALAMAVTQFIAVMKGLTKQDPDIHPSLAKKKKTKK